MNHKLFSVAFTLTALLSVTSIALAAPAKFASVADLALYKGADRQQILEEGAKKEGSLVFYTTSVWAPPLVKAFQNKYPFIKVDTWRAGSSALMPRVLEEYSANKYIFDVIEVSEMSNLVLKGAGISQPFYSPHLAVIEEDAITKLPNGGVLEAPFRTSGQSLGYNTKLIAKEQLPKTYKDLLDPKWKGKMTTVGGTTGSDWLGTIFELYGEDFVKQLAKQDIKVHMVSGRALCDMVITGEYSFSPTIYDSHVAESKGKGAPVDWMPLEPVHVNLGLIALPKHVAHPYSALLFIDFELSREGAAVNKAGGYSPMRKDLAPILRAYKKYYGPKSLEQGKKWVELFDELFVKK